MVRLIHGDTNPAGPGFKERVVDTPANGEYDGRHQAIRSGSHVTVVDRTGHLALTRCRQHARVRAAHHAASRRAAPAWPHARPGQGPGYALDDRRRASAADGRRRLEDGTGRVGRAALRAVLVFARRHLRPRHRRGGDLPGARAQLVQQPALAHGRPARSHDRARQRGGRTRGCGRGLHDRGRPVRTAAISTASSTAPRCGVARSATASSRPSATAPRRQAPGWSPTGTSPTGIGPRGVPTDHVRDVAGLDLFGICVNQPARGMTGWNWDCSEECYRHAPELYGAIHFHDDDLDDCGWETDVALTIPDDMRSGVYALRVAPGRGRGPHSVLRDPAARHRDRADRVPRADRELPRLRQRPHRARRAGRPVDPRSHLGALRAGLLPLRQPRPRTVDVRLALRRRAASASRRRAGRS